MGLYQKKTKYGQRWFYRGQYQGQKYCGPAIFKTKTEAKKAEASEIDRLYNNLTNPITDMPLKDLMDARLDEIQGKKSGAYYRDTKRYLKAALHFWGVESMVSEITKQKVNDLLLHEANRLKKAKKQNYAVNALIRSLNALFNFGMRDYGLEKNPLKFASKFSIDIKLKYIPTDEQINAVKAKFDQKQAFLFDFVDQTACRINEAIRFKAEDIDGDLITLWTRKSKNSNLTPRRIPKPECLNGYKGKGKVFEWTDHPSFLERAIASLEQPKWNWHSLRHRRASIWANKGMSLLELMQRLGHSNIETTQIYLRLLGFNYH